MKKLIKIALLVLVAIMVLAASRSGDSLRPKKAAKPASACYSQEEVLFLMNANGWTKKEAVKVLELSCEYSVTPN